MPVFRIRCCEFCVVLRDISGSHGRDYKVGRVHLFENMFKFL